MNCKPDVNHSEKVVPEGGFEPPTRGFSIQRLANENNGECVNRGENGAIGINALENDCKPNNAQTTANILLPDNGQKLPNTSDCAGKSCTDNGAIGDVSANAILADLARVKAVFQLRTITLILKGMEDGE